MESKSLKEATMDKLLDIALCILVIIGVILAICATSIVVGLCLELLFKISIF